MIATVNEMALPSLSGLNINKTHPTEASWRWDPGKYRVTVSIDAAVLEQIDGLGSLDMDGNFQLPMSHRVSQMDPLQLLHVLREYTIQRLWDMHSAVPRIDLPLTGSLPNAPTDSGQYEPFPESESELIRNVAIWAKAVQNTLPKTSKGMSTVDETDNGNIELEGVEVDEIAERIEEALRRAREEQGDKEMRLLEALLEIDQKLAELDADVDADTYIDLMPFLATEMRDHKIATFILKNRKKLCEPRMIDLRLSPKRTWSNPNASAAKLQRWMKMELLLIGGEKIDKKNFKPSAHVPGGLDGSFYSGDLNPPGKDELDAAALVGALTMEHIIPRSHMSNAQLIRECSHPEHLAMITVMVFQAENSSRGDKFLPLGSNMIRVAEMQTEDPTAVYKITAGKFVLSKRQQAARMLAAGYLTLPMLERRPDPNTELGSRNGGLYEKYTKDIFKLLSNTVANTKYNRVTFRRAWMWEVGLSLLLWYFLQQPYNPLAMIAYRKTAKLESDDWLLDYFKDLLFARLRGSDLIAEMIRREMREEIMNAPGTGSDEKVDYAKSVELIRGKIDALKKPAKRNFDAM